MLNEGITFYTYVYMLVRNIKNALLLQAVWCFARQMLLPFIVLRVKPFMHRHPVPFIFKLNEY